jgi:AraC-like DNA-binding protein
LAALPARKKATTEELYRRLLLARDFIHDHYNLTIRLATLAATANLSEYHF